MAPATSFDGRWCWTRLMRVMRARQLWTSSEREIVCVAVFGCFVFGMASRTDQAFVISISAPRPAPAPMPMPMATYSLSCIRCHSFHGFVALEPPSAGPVSVSVSVQGRQPLMHAWINKYGVAFEIRQAGFGGMAVGLGWHGI